MAKYESGAPRQWALETLRGCCGCVLPTFTSDLAGLNEAAIRHDVQREKDLGMKAILIVSDGGTTDDEYKQMVDICVSEAGEDLVTFLHAGQQTFDAMIDMIAHGERAGVD